MKDLISKVAAIATLAFIGLAGIQNAKAAESVATPAILLPKLATTPAQCPDPPPPPPPPPVDPNGCDDVPPAPCVGSTRQVQYEDYRNYHENGQDAPNRGPGTETCTANLVWTGMSTQTVTLDCGDGEPQEKEVVTKTYNCEIKCVVSFEGTIAQVTNDPPTTPRRGVTYN